MTSQVQRPTLGVLITYHGEGALLTECLESLRPQMKLIDEVVVRDDASTIFAERFVPKMRGVTISRSDANVGPSASRNALLRASRCDYIHFHDCDDLFDRSWAARIRRAIEEGAPDVVLTEVSSTLADGTIVPNLIGLRSFAGSEPVRFCLRSSILPAAGTYRRTAVERIGGYREWLRQSEDYDFHIRLMASEMSTLVIDEPLVTRRQRTASHSGDARGVWREAVRALVSLRKELPDRYGNDIADALARMASNLYGLGDRRAARYAYMQASRAGRSTFAHRPRPFRTLARLTSPLIAEGMARQYRRFVPARWRRTISQVWESE
jgi:glycosyltransferase involved in cell wall biosynthesis